MGVKGGAGSRKDVQEGMDGGGGVTQVKNKVRKFLWGETHGLLTLTNPNPISGKWI